MLLFKTEYWYLLSKHLAFHYFQNAYSKVFYVLIGYHIILISRRGKKLNKDKTFIKTLIINAHLFIQQTFIECQL